MNTQMTPENKRMSFDLARWVLALIVGGAGWAYAVSGKSEQVNLNTRMVQDHESRMRALERSSVNVERDVLWIRQRIEQQGETK